MEQVPSEDSDMRLTLRTLLAYLDDVLTPEEAEPLKQRIEESEFASTLVQRIRHTLRRLRLSAPKVDGRGLGFDPNSVAEYLDSTMPPDRVVDFEKVCLESDVHLAEVAACHQILAKVLNEHADVPEALRNRVYGLAALAKDVQLAPQSRAAADNGQDAAAPSPPAAESAADEPAAPPLPPPPPVERHIPVVPDYLRPEPRRRSPWYLIPIGLLALLAVAFFVPPLSQFNPLLKPADQVAQNTTTGPAAKPATKTGDASAKDEAKSDETVREKQPPDQPRPDQKPAILPEEPDREATLKEPAPNRKTPLEPAEAVAKAESDVPPPRPKPADVPEKPVARPEAPESSGAELGRYISDETVLAAFDPRERMWMRVAPRSLIVDGQRCLSLPVYRPQIVLSSGVQITLVGETSVLFNRNTANDLPMLSVDCGRLLLHSIALANVTTEMNLNGIRGTLTLDTPESEAAVEVYSYLPPGADPLAEGAEGSYTVAHLMSVNGSCTWEEEGLEPVQINTNFVHILINGDEGRRQGPVKLPAWIDAANTNTLDREAAKMVEPLLPADRSLDLALEEQASHRRLDVRVHVARCLAFLGNYGTLIKHLSEEEYRSYWFRPDGYLDLIRKQLARGPAMAERVRAELIEARGERDGNVLYRMLQGYSEKQLVAGADDALVTQLAHPNMDIRVLAIDNLNRITGKMHLYNPAQPPEKSRSRILNWQDELKDGQIRYAVKPSPLVEFKPLEERDGDK